MNSVLRKKVSVVMCTYNGAAFLKEQLETILNQTYPIYEIIVQDDGSTDKTIEILNSYKENNPTIKLFYNEEERGVNSNFFSALKKASGDYIAISDQDDIWELNKIEKQITWIGGSLLCFHLSRPFSEDGVPIAFDARIPNHSLMRMIYFNMIPGHTMLIRRELLKYVMDEHCFLYDALLAIAAGVSSSITFIPEVLVNHRRYGGAYSYYVPISNAHNIKNVVSYIIGSVQNMIHNRSKMIAHFNAMSLLLSRYMYLDNSGPFLKEALKLCDLYRECTLVSLLKASIICVRYKTHIFYTSCDGSFVSSVRAFFHPLLMFQYYK